MNLLEVSDLVVEFKVKDGDTRKFRAVDGVSFTIAERETVGLVGESGSGKSTIGRAILGLTKPTSGEVVFKGEDITRRFYASAPDPRAKHSGGVSRPV